MTLATLTGDNGLLQKVQTAKETSTDAEIEEEIRLAWNKVYADSYLNNYTSIDKANALKTELEKNKLGETVTINNLALIYRGRTIEINETTGEINIKQLQPMITVKGLTVKKGDIILTNGSKTEQIGTALTINFEASVTVGSISNISPSIPYKSKTNQINKCRWN